MRDTRSPDRAGLPEVDVRATDPSGSDVHKAVVRSWFWRLYINNVELVGRIGLNGHILRLAGEHLSG